MAASKSVILRRVTDGGNASNLTPPAEPVLSSLLQPTPVPGGLPVPPAPRTGNIQAVPFRRRLSGLSPTVRGILWMLFSAAIIAQMHVLVRALSQELPTFEIVFFRNLVALLTLLPFLMRQERHLWKSQRPGLQALRGVVGICAMTAWFYSLGILPVADATALSFTAVLVTTLGAVLFLGEKVGPRRWAAIGVGFLGVLIIVRPGFGVMTWEALWVLLSTTLWASSLLIVKTLGRTDTPVTITFYASVYFTVFSFVPALLVWQWPSWPQMGMLVVIGVTATMAHVALANALRLADAASVMPLDYTRLLWTAGVGWIAFAEFPDLWTWVGGTVIFAATVYITVRESRRKKRATVAVPGEPPPAIRD